MEQLEKQQVYVKKVIDKHKKQIYEK